MHDSCDLLSSLSGHIVVSSFVCALSDLIHLCDRLHGSRKRIARVSSNMVACVTESMSVLKDPATYGILNSELTNCPRTAAVLGELAAQRQQMMGTLQRVEQEAVSSQSLAHRHREHRQDTDQCDCKPTAIEGRRTTLPEELVRRHTNWRLCT